MPLRMWCSALIGCLLCPIAASRAQVDYATAALEGAVLDPQGIADRRPADIKTLSQILFTEPLVGNQIAFSHPFEDLEDDPVSQCAINGFGRKTRRFVELSKKHISRQYTISPARN